MKSLSGLELAGFIQERQAKDVRRLNASKIYPKLAIIQTKDDPVIDLYVRLKKQYGADIGVEVELHKISQGSCREVIKSLNNDPNVQGIIVQLPLENIKETEEIVNLVDPKKDVDGLGDPSAPWPSHLDGVQGTDEQRTEPYEKYGEGAAQSVAQQSAKSTSRATGSASGQAGAVRGSWLEAATPMAIMWLLAGHNVDLKNKKVLIIGRGKLVGGPLEKMLRSSNVDVTVADSTSDLKALSLEADVIVAAANSASILKSDMLKPGTVVVDAGTASESGKTVGNVDGEVYERDDLVITPQKGGVGPLTVCALFENVIRTAANG
jgi:methylenetetrahydrofolate dehydrogenase (NADP+)/methenyltetrahydrofolate cyclohydrolase